MSRLTIALVVVAYLFCWSVHLSAQASQVDYSFYEEVYNGTLAVYEDCLATNPQTDEYLSVEAGCSITNPDGSQVWATNGGYQTGVSYAYNHYSPVTVFGEWSGYASYELSMSEDCCDGDGYSYFTDTDGFSDNGVQSCSVSSDSTTCYLYGSGEEEWLDYDPLRFATSTGTDYVDPVLVQIYPSSVSLDGGESQEFTIAVAGVPSDGSTGVTWTISSLAGGTESSTTSSYTYTAPQVVSSETSLTLKACSIVAPSACSTPVTITLLAESIIVETPSPSVLFADGVSTSAVYADLTNAPDNASVTWSAPPGTINQTGNTTATFLAPTAATAFTTGTANPLPVTITGSYANNTGIKNTTNITLVEPVSISGVVPTSLTAGTTTAVTITGAGFGTSPTVTVNNPNGGAFSGITFTPTATPSNTQIQGNLFIPLNTVNIGATQPFTLTVSATTAGLTSTAPSGSISIVPVAYTYTIALQVTNPSLTYGYSTTVTPVMTCKVASTGSACSSTVFNAQTALASFSLTQSAVYGSLSSSTGSNQSPPTFTVAQLGSYPAPTVVVQACVTVPVPSAVCATTNFSIPVTSITLNPPTITGPLAGGKTQAFTASIQNEGKATGLTWTLTPSPSSAAPGTLTSATTTITVQGSPTSGTSGPNTYTAPATITSAAAVMLNVCMTANTSICATPVTIQLPGFSIMATNNNPSQTALSLGHSMSYNITASALDGFSGTVGLSVSGLPAGVTATLSAPAITTSTSGSVTLTLTSAYSTSTYIGNSTISVTGSSGSMAIPASIPLTTRPLQYAGQCGVPTTITRFYPNPLFPY